MKLTNDQIAAALRKPNDDAYEAECAEKAQLGAPAQQQPNHGQIVHFNLKPDRPPQLEPRAELAARAMQGLLSCGIGGRHKLPTQLAREAVEHADALILELQRTMKP